MKGILDVDSLYWIEVRAYSPCQSSVEPVIHRIVDDSID